MDRCTDGKQGKIIILNGVPRSGKSSIVTAIQNSFDGVWLNLGVDRYKPMIPDRYQPGIGLRPGGENPEIEPLVAALYTALYESIAIHSQLGINVVTDIGHHDSYSVPLNILPQCARILKDYPALFVGVKCPIDEILKRRVNTAYPAYDADGSVSKPVLLWQQAVHSPGIYDIEVDTSIHSPEEIALIIHKEISQSNFTAINRLANTISF